MTTPTHIINGSGNKNRAVVSKNGELAVSPLKYDEIVSVLLGTVDQGYTYYKPQAGMQFVVTGMYFNADSNVTTGSNVEVFECTALNSTVVDKQLFSIEILKNENRDFPGLNFLINEGKFLNGKADDDDVRTSVTGYYVNKID
jgi:hypothetical protein